MGHVHMIVGMSSDLTRKGDNGSAYILTGLIVFNKRLRVGRSFPWAAQWAQTRLQTQPARGLGQPGRAAKRPTATQTLPQTFHLGFGLRLIDVLQLTLQTRHRARIEDRPGGRVSSSASAAALDQAQSWARSTRLARERKLTMSSFPRHGLGVDGNPKLP
jgi:hypothetical protein